MTLRSAMADNPRFHWSQWIFPGPRRVFTAAELARAGGTGWSSAIDCYVYTNVVLIVAIFYTQLPPGSALAVVISVIAVSMLGLLVARWLWRHPTRTRYNLVSLATGVAIATTQVSLSKLGWKTQVMESMPFVIGGMSLMMTSWWFLTLYRTQQIESRLRELDAQQERIAMAQRLATAQIQPHFLFNTLASLQHWVDTRDERAGPMLRSLTRYLRATLPMFAQERLPLEQELQIVRSYLEVMQARLGQRLTWSVDLEAGTQPVITAASLPPGTLLTLAENAITHGIEPSLRGGHVAIRVGMTASANAGEGGLLRLEVEDSGQGLTPDAYDGLGLSNTRERLQAQFGAAAQLGLERASPGCLAWIELPLQPSHGALVGDQAAAALPHTRPAAGPVPSIDAAPTRPAHEPTTP
ncbi:sensor histidine kinase [Roseateles amylovorans]|uniref:Histidine kinase n=1 Tax=Roseateles amylovorans TaxID=2978473 RepID=A0ABY6AYH1_9BURK|nr:histidine kinase [Roseateles amylovorans]UXH77963.1 histidine kinase [Roseateles amylovorans]